MKTQNVLLTGAIRGLGKAVSDFLIKKGINVLGTTSNSKFVKKNEKSNLRYLDLKSDRSIEALVSYINRENQPVDAIIHNSGIAYLDPIDVLSESELQNIFKVNFFGPIKLTKGLLPLLRRQKRGKIIFISSVVSVDHWPYLGAYAASKAAIETAAFEWAVLLKKWNIEVSIIRPNPLPTDMSIYRSNESSSSPYPELNNRDLEWESTESACETILHILTRPSSEYRFEHYTGMFSEKAVSKFHKKNAYQKAIKRYQNLLKLND